MAQSPLDGIRILQQPVAKIPTRFGNHGLDETTALRQLVSNEVFLRRPISSHTTAMG